MEGKEDWPLLENSLKSIISNRKSPSEFSRSKSKGLKTMLKMPKEELRRLLMQECENEKKFIATHNNVNAATQPLYKPSNIAIQFLAMNDIKPLKKRNPKFPRAQYFCHLCEYHCDTIEVCISHIEDTRHSRLAKKQELQTTLFHLPRPNKKHLEALDNLLTRIEMTVGLSEAEVQNRQSIAQRVDEILRLTLPGAFVRSYGSSMTGMGLKTSGLNLDLQIPPEIPPHVALIKAYEMLVLKSDEFNNVVPEFNAKIPAVTFVTMQGNIRCELSLNNHLAYQTSALLRDYVRLEPRFKTLVVALRYWAHLCKLDRQAEGTLPPHSFSLMLIHFLQRLKAPVLPCIHEYLNLEDVENYKTPVDKLKEWKSENTMSLAELWIDFFESYSLGILAADTVVSIRSTSNCTRDDKQWKGKKMLIEDPFSTKRSLSRSVNSSRVLDFIADCFRIAYLYFGTVQTTLGPIVTKIIVPPAPEKKKSKKRSESLKTEEAADEEVDNVINKLKLDTDIPNDIQTPKPLPKAITLEELEKSLIQEEFEDDLDDETDVPMHGETFEAFAARMGSELTPKQAQRITELVPKNMILFKFDGDILTAGQAPIVICSVCGTEGHLQNKCPDEQLPPIVELPRLPPESKYIHLLNDVCRHVMQSRVPSPREISARENIIKELTEFARESHDFQTAVLTVFGSSVNGFSFSKSDLDISLTFTDHETDEDLDAIDIIENLAAKLMKKPGIMNVQAITSAKVPIIKFTTKMPKIECDISLYNILALENTRMLRTYASIDNRVKVLGYVVKEWAKKCDIGDASRGSLSSYAYILMLLYYLQQVQPPVIPVLQELHGNDTVKPVKTVDGWNAWFYDDLQRLKDVWPGLGRNKMSVAELWIGFLSFYAVDFADASQVICTRMSRPLSKFEKMWNSPCIAIEDPFDLSHNLGAGISRRMNVYIKSAFIKTRELFGIPSNRIPVPQGIETIKQYFFDPNLMTDGLPPNDRGCRACGKIGHLVRDCPKKKAVDDHKKFMKNKKKQQFQQERERHQQQQQQHKASPLNERKKSPSPLQLGPERGPQEPDQERGPDPDFIALLQARGLTNMQVPPPQMKLPPMPPPTMPGMPPLPALPKAGINVEDLERNLVQAESNNRIRPPLGQLPSQPPPGFSNDLFPPQHAMLRQQTAGPWPGFPPIGGLPPPMPMNSFGLGAGPGMMPPPFSSPMNMMPSAFMGMPPVARPPSPPRQDKPLQLNQLPGFNLFGGGFFDSKPPPPGASMPPTARDANREEEK